MSKTTSIRLSTPAAAALEWLRKHPLGYVLNQEASKAIIREALARGWKP